MHSGRGDRKHPGRDAHAIHHCERAIAEINKKDGPFVWKDSYVFMMDLEGKMLAHPIKPDLIGKNLLETPDKGPRQKAFIGRRKSSRWRSRRARAGSTTCGPSPARKAPSKKLTYIYRVPGKDVFVGAGVYE